MRKDKKKTTKIVFYDSMPLDAFKFLLCRFRTCLKNKFETFSLNIHSVVLTAASTLKVDTNKGRYGF